MSRFHLVFTASGIFILIVVMAAIADGSTKTIITTTSVEENPRLSRTEAVCARRMIWQEMLSHCSMYLSFKGRREESMALIANLTQEHLQFCCKQLANMGEECMCDAIHTLAFMQGWTQPETGTDMLSMAQHLPKHCSLMSEECQMKEVLF